jgi:hypothetical protein
VGSATLGSNATLENSQCTLNLAGSSTSGSGNNLTLNLALTFSTSFLDTQNVYVVAGDVSGLYGSWQQMGTWTVPGAGEAVSVRSARRAGLSFNALVGHNLLRCVPRENLTAADRR